MNGNNITLTPEELEEIKNDERFRENITIRLKSTEGKIDEMSETMGSLTNLRGWVSAHTWAFAILCPLLIGIFALLLRQK